MQSLLFGPLRRRLNSLTRAFAQNHEHCELSPGPRPPSRASCGVNFVNFVGFGAREHPGEQPFRHAGIAARSLSGGQASTAMPACGCSSAKCRRRARKPTKPTHPPALARARVDEQT